MGVVVAARVATDRGETMSQPTCAGCGATEITYVDAARYRWARVMGAMRCHACAARFPAWMRERF